MGTSMAKFSYLIPYLFLHCLHAHGLTLPNPSVISQPVALSIDSNVTENSLHQDACGVPNSGLSFSSTGGVSIVPEQPPEGLTVEFKYTRGGLMTKYDVWTAITRSIGIVALRNWNEQENGAMVVNIRESNAQIRFVSSIIPPRYQTKTMIWTLAEAFDIFNERGHYSNCLLTTQLENRSGKRILGIGSIKSTLSTALGSQDEPSVVNLATNMSNGGSSTEGVSVPVFINQSSVPNTDDIVSRPSGGNPSNLYAGERGLALSIDYLDHGASISAQGFFNLVINSLVYAAQNDPKNEPCMVLTAYNAAEDYTFSMGPTSDAARENLPWARAIPALGYLPNVMLLHQAGGRWAELVGTIKMDGAYIGKLGIRKGDHRSSRPSSCDMVRRDIGVDVVGNDNSGDEA